MSTFGGRDHTLERVANALNIDVEQLKYSSIINNKTPIKRLGLDM
jgi:hypothetical protein